MGRVSIGIFLYFYALLPTYLSGLLVFALEDDPVGALLNAVETLEFGDAATAVHAGQIGRQFVLERYRAHRR